MMRARRGMTLMELLVGLTLTGMMAAVGAAAFSSIIDHRRVIRESTVEMERAAALRELLTTWISSGTPTPLRGGNPIGRGGSSSATLSGRVVSAAAGSGDEFRFTTTALTPAMVPSVQIRLFIDADAGTPESGLTIEYQMPNNGPLVRRELEPAVGALLVEYLDQRTNRWRAAAEYATIQPIAVRVALLPPEKGELPAILQLPIIHRMGAQ